MPLLRKVLRLIKILHLLLLRGLARHIVKKDLLLMTLFPVMRPVRLPAIPTRLSGRLLEIVLRLSHAVISRVVKVLVRLAVIRVSHAHLVQMMRLRVLLAHDFVVPLFVERVFLENVGLFLLDSRKVLSDDVLLVFTDRGEGVVAVATEEFLV